LAHVEGEGISFVLDAFSNCGLCVSFSKGESSPLQGVVVFWAWAIICGPCWSASSELHVLLLLVVPTLSCGCVFSNLLRGIKGEVVVVGRLP